MKNIEQMKNLLHFKFFPFKVGEIQQQEIKQAKW